MASSGTQGAGGPARRVARRPAGEEDGALYFTYGSNLHVAQMAERCPASKFVGKGKLTSYRWQINQRGVANIVKTGDKEDVVRGLVFEVTQADVRALDRFEGVRSGAYSRAMLEVRVTPHDGYARKKTTEVAARIEAFRDSPHSRGATLAGRGTIPEVKLPAIVYISTNHKSDGAIRAEYIPRMANAIADAKVLGVSRTYIKDVMVPRVGDPNAEPGIAQPGPSTPSQPTVSEAQTAQTRPAGRISQAAATELPGVRQPGPVQGMFRRLRLTRPEQRRDGERLATQRPLAERPVERRNGANLVVVEPNTGGRRATSAGGTERRSNGANLVVVQPGAGVGRRTPRTEREARELREFREARDRERDNNRERDQERRIQADQRDQERRRRAPVAQDELAATENQNGNERPTNGGGESASTSANANANPTLPRRPATKSENGGAQKATANSESSGTSGSSNGSNGSTTPPKRAGSNPAENGSAPKPTGNGEGNGTATTAGGSGSAPKRSAAKTESGGAQKPAANCEGNGAAATANGAAAAPKRAAAKAENGSGASATKADNGGTTAAANGTTPTPKKTAAKADGNAAAAANSTGTGTGTGTGATKKASTKSDNTGAQS